jgi:hypothetical protein
VLMVQLGQELAPVSSHHQTAFHAIEPMDRALAGWALVLVISPDVDEVRLAEAALGLGKAARRCCHPTGRSRPEADVVQ